MVSSIIIILISLWSFATCKPHRPNLDKDYEESSVEDLRLRTSFDNVKTLEFYAFNNNYSLVVTPSNSIFSPNFKILNIDTDSNGKPIISESQKPNTLKGPFYVEKYGQGSFHAENLDGQLFVEGIVGDGIRIWNEGGIHRAIRLPQSSMKISGIGDEETKIHKRSSRFRDNTAIVELIIMLDNTVSTAILQSGMSIQSYLGIYWNLVQRRFSVITNPNIRFSINAATTIKDMTWFDRSRIKPGIIDGLKELQELGRWLFTYLDILPNFDVVLMQTGLEIVYYTHYNGSDLIDESPAGVSNTGGLCQAFEQSAQVYTCGIVENKYPLLFTDVFTTVHELAHIFGAPHDGDLEAKKCHKMGYIMEAEVPFRTNEWDFSPCSHQIISSYINSKKGYCLRSFDLQHHVPIPILDQYPDPISTDDYCKGWFNYDPQVFAHPIQPDICWRIICRVAHHEVSPGGMPEGTPCGQNKICLKGKCVPHRNGQRLIN